MPYQILVTARSFSTTSPMPMKMLVDAGCQVVQPADGAIWSEEDLIAAIASADGLIVGTDPVTARVIAAAPRLRVIAKHGTGVDNIDLGATRQRGIIVTNTPGANAGAVAELAIGLMFVLARNIVLANQQGRTSDWKPIVGMELVGKTLGLVGLGQVGKTVVQRIAGLKMTILAYDPIRDEVFARRFEVQYVSLYELLCAADFVSLHAPLEESTRGMIGTTALEKMKPTAFLLNTARAELVDETALFESLRNRRIAGAAIDVLAHNSHSPLHTLPNVIVTPHIGAHTTDAITAMSAGAAENLVAVLQGRQALNRVV